MMKFVKSLALVFFLLFYSCSSTHYYYNQNIHQVPLFKEKNEIRLSGGFGSGEIVGTREVQAAYSITDKFALMAGYMKTSMPETTVNGIKDGAKYRYFDAGFGYYKVFKNFGIFEVYGGFGASKQHHYYLNDTLLGYDSFGFAKYKTISKGTGDLSYFKYFIQPSFGYTHKYFDVAASVRISEMYINRINNHITRDFLSYSDFETMSKKRHTVLFEPGITIRGGWQYVKLQFQYAYTGVLNNSHLKFDSQNFSVGLYLSFAKRFRLKA